MREFARITPLLPYPARVGWLSAIASSFAGGLSGRPGPNLTASPQSVRFGLGAPLDLLAAISAGGQLAPRISRAEALQVPAVMRGRNMIAGTLATLPVHALNAERREVPNPLLAQIDPDVPNAVTLAAIFEDLLFEGISWLRIVEFRAPGGFPSKANHVPPQSVTIQPAGPSRTQDWISPDMQLPASGAVYVDGVFVPDRELIRIDSPNPPFLVHAARAIRAALMLDQTAAQYANDPQALGWFTPAEGAIEPEDDEVTELLNEWEAARRQRSTGYVSGALRYNSNPLDPEKLQLAEARQHAVLEIARALGVDPEDLGVSTTSRTYQNGEQRRQALLDFTLGAYVSAFQDRMSMGDVTPRGQVVRMKFDGFLRSDTLTRMQAYTIGKPLGAYTIAEIRELEDRPPLTDAELAALGAGPAAPAAPTTGVPPMSTRPHLVKPAASFAAATDEHLTFMVTDDATAASFKVDRESRVISGLALPWGKIASPDGFTKWSFREGSLHWSSDTRVKLDMDHDPGQTIGRGQSLRSTAAGLEVAMKVARGAEGDRALSLAEDGVYDGLSVQIHFEDGDQWLPVEQEDGTIQRDVVSAALSRIALTPTPAFDDARVTSVAASQHTGGKMKCSKCGQVHAADAACTVALDKKTDGPDMERFATLMADKLGEHQAATFDKLGEAINAGFLTALENIDDPQEVGRTNVRAARFKVVSEPPVYSMNGTGFSLVRDAWYAGREKEDEAIERLRKYRKQTEEVAKLAAAQAGAAFTTSTTGNSGQIIPPGYRPDLYVNQLQQGRPLVAMCSQGVIANATPFTVPVFSSATGATADHVEGTNPTDGTLTFATKTVTPGGISGRMVLTREIVDSSNPAIDQIAVASMRESYARQTEGKVYTLLNGANGAGGTITTGFVPSGAQASTYVGTTGTPPAAIAGIRKELARYPFNRFAFPSAAAMGQNATQIVAGAVDSTGRPMFPWVSLGGAQNAAGVGMNGGWMVDGLLLVPAWSITGVAAGDSQILILNSSDAWVWESPTLSFRFEEKSGPANIELALFGYFGTHLLRPVGLSGIRLT